MKITSSEFAVLLAANLFVVGCNRRPDSDGQREVSLTKPETQVETPNEPTVELTATLRQAVNRFIEAADESDTAKVARSYDSRFVNYRVTDAGELVRLDRDQVLSFMARTAGPHFPTKSTTIHHVEVIGDTGFVLLTRVKDLGNGWEPMFYSLVWTQQDGNWHLLREFVHQRSLPTQR